MTTELKEITEKSYGVFGTYRAVKPLDVCTVCCITESEENALVSLGVEYIPFELLYKYNTAATTEKPDINEFKHFLPRFLELTAELKFLSHSVELAFKRFDYYEETDWTKAEKEILEDFSIAFFRYCLTIYPLPGLERIESVLVMLSKAYVDIEKLLALWAEIATKESVLHLSDLVNRGFKKHKPHELNSPFDEKNLGRKIADWLSKTDFDDRFLRIIEEMIMDPSDLEDYTLKELSWTYDSIKMKKGL